MLVNTKLYCIIQTSTRLSRIDYVKTHKRQVRSRKRPMMINLKDSSLRALSRTYIRISRSCRTLNELNQLVGRHSMIHLLCVQILPFFRPSYTLRQNQLLNKRRIESALCLSMEIIKAKCLVWPTVLYCRNSKDTFRSQNA